MRVFGFYKALPVTDEKAFVEEEWQTPVPAGHDILVSVRAVSVNPVDTKVRAGKADDGVLKVAGWDAAGVVVGVGESVALFKEGDEVWYAGDIGRAGSNAEFQLVDERIVAKKPSSIDFAQAAAMPLTVLTAWEAMYERLGMPSQAGESKDKRLLLINGAGGVGSIAIQLSKLMGFEVVATASRQESQEWCRALGADKVIPHSDLEGVGDNYADWILCCHDTDQYFDQAARLVRPFGKICFLASAKEKHNIQALMQKSAGIVWEFMFTRSMLQTTDLVRQHEILERAAALVDQGSLRSTLQKTLSPLNTTTLREGHALIESGGMVGKLVITV